MRLHAAIWTDVAKMIHECQIPQLLDLPSPAPRRPALPLQLLRYHGVDFAADMAKMAADPVTQKWWELCKPCQQPLPDRRAGEWWAQMDEAFHQE